MTTERWILIGIFVFFVFLLITFCYYAHRRLNRLEDTTQKLTNHVLLQQKVLDQHHSVLLPQSPESPLSGSGGGFDFVSIPSNPPPSFSSSHESSVTSSSPSPPPPISSFFDGIISGGGSGGSTPPPLRMVGSLLNVLTSIQPPSSPVILHNDDDDEDEEVIQPVQELSPEEIKKELKKELDELDSPSSPSSSTPATIEPSKTIPVSSS